MALKCSVGADRTNRAGVFELQEWLRPDRPYCKSDIFRELILDNTTATEADCRETIREKLDKCNHGICPQCISSCNYPVARTVGSVLKCMDMKKHFGFLHYMHTTDAGQLARSMHGARRKDNWIAVRANSQTLSHYTHYTNCHCQPMCLQPVRAAWLILDWENCGPIGFNSAFSSAAALPWFDHCLHEEGELERPCTAR